MGEPKYVLRGTGEDGSVSEIQVSAEHLHRKKQLMRARGYSVEVLEPIVEKEFLLRATGEDGSIIEARVPAGRKARRKRELEEQGLKVEVLKIGRAELPEVEEEYGWFGQTFAVLVISFAVFMIPAALWWMIESWGILGLLMAGFPIGLVGGTLHEFGAREKKRRDDRRLSREL